MSQTDNESDDALDEENSIEEGINEPQEPKARQVPRNVKNARAALRLGWQHLRTWLPF